MTTACLVGNGPSLLLEPMGKLIDGYDTVIRMKHLDHQKAHPETFGTRTDILAGSLTIAPQLKKYPAGMYWILLDSRHEGEEAKRLLTDMEWQFKDLNMHHYECAATRWRRKYMELRDSRPQPAMHPQMQASRYSDEMGEKHPSQGFQTLVYAAATLDMDHIVLAGFDNLYTGEFNWSLTRGTDWTNYPFHRWDIEHDMVPMVAKEYDVDIQFLLPEEPADAAY